MDASVVRLTESALRAILQFVASAGRLSQRRLLYESLRRLGGGELQLDEMVIGHCASPPGAVQPCRCSRFDPVMSLSEAPPNLPMSPCAAANAVSGCHSMSAAADARPGHAATAFHGRVVVCHRSKLDAQSLCIVCSAKERSHDELLALLKILLPYVDDAFRRIEPESAHPTEAAAASCAASSIHALTAREKEVLYWTAQGKGCWETGHIVGISERTVKFHLQNIYRKLNVVNRTQAVARAAQIQLFEAAA